ncbi:phytase [Alteromonas sp. MMG017]|uniref:phytase n=1 Tax=Alteromonas sp. MMG017 TaxID=2822692 RepID=UPI001B39D2DD|nr:phytase [Alteromonas sp. MMG017]MBQ4829738.1 phytase [Alteromonas sp. MMG017]
MNKVNNKLIKFAIKTSQLGFCLAVMASANAFASSSTDLTLTETGAGVAAESETTYELNGRTISVTISETNGLTVADSKNILASQKGHFVAAGNYLIPNESVGKSSAEAESTNGPFIQTLVFDINSQQIRSYTIGTQNTSNHAISITQTSATDVKDSEALCSAKIDSKLQFINIDALGMLTQYLAIPAKSGSALTVHPLRTLAIGPGIKSCALGVSDHTPNFTVSDSKVSDAETSHARTKHIEQTIYLADEYAGVWAMPADEEAEVERTLIFNQPDTPVEGVATLNRVEAHKTVLASLITNSPDTNRSAANSSRTKSPATTILGIQETVTAWVSPEHSGLWLHNTCATNFFGFDKEIAPEDIVLWVKGDTVHANIYDDNSGGTLTTNITQAIATLNSCHTNQASLIKTPTSFNETSFNETPMLSAIELKPIYETDVVENYGDAADDPAIWVNKNNPSKSVVIGTNKKGSLNAYNLQGELVASHKVGRVNNVGVAYDWAPQHDIAVASNRSSNSMSVFFIDKQTGELTFNTNIPTPLNDIYGLCVFSINNHTQVLVNSTDGQYLRYLLNAPTDVNSNAIAKTNTNTYTNNASMTEKADHSQVSATLIHDFTLPSQPEGCVVDSDAQIAYLGEEGAGIWALDVSEIKTMPSSTRAKAANKNALNRLINKTPMFIVPIESPVTADVEGLSLFDVDGVRYLIASSQGNNQYAVYESESPYNLVGMISIGANYDKGIDGVSETDGLETTNANLGGPFKNGLLVVQDGRNVMPSQRQNFKLVTGDDLADAIRSHVSNRN